MPTDFPKLKLLLKCHVTLVFRQTGFHNTFKQVEEESLCVCDLDVMLLLWARFFLNLFLVVFVQEAEGVLHADRVAHIQALAVLSKVLRANSYFCIFLFCS